jgi:hypothetical protein
MTRKLFFLISIVVILLVLASTVTAKYIPYVEPLDGDWGDVAHPWQTPGGFSTVLYGRMGDIDDVDVVGYEFIEPTSSWMVEMGVPMCGEHFAAFAPVVAVIGEGLPDAEVPFELPRGMGAVVLDEGREIDVPASENYLFNADAQRFMRYSADTLLPSGNYLIAIWEPNGRVGAYALSMIGVHPDYVDAMESDRIDEAFTLVNSGEWMGQDCDAPVSRVAIPLRSR